MRGIAKAFPGVQALADVALSLNAGEVLALVGENGAGKSTLMKILAGGLAADAGEILIDGKRVTIDTPRAAERLGVGMIYQEFNLVAQMTAVENLVLGDEPTRRGFLDTSAALDRARRIFAELKIAMPLNVPVGRLSVGQQQLVEIAKVLSKRARIIVMDEPTAALTENEIERLFALVKRLKASGNGIVYISHRLEELARIADRVTILRDGRVVETRAERAFSEDEIVAAMVGRQVDAHYPQLPPVPEGAPVVLEMRGLSRPPLVNGVNLQVRAGEIVGFAGLIGAGRTEILRAIAGADIPRAGDVLIDGRVARIRSPIDAIGAGIAFITEDRKAQGLVLGMSVRENVTLAHLAEFVNRDLMIDRAREVRTTQSMIGELDIRTPSTEQLVRNLSGGTQQKVVLAKWLIGTARVLLFDEPTRGIDVGAKAEIYALMIELAKRGSAIVMVSSELPEVLGMAHRIFAVRGGALVQCFAHDEATPDAVMLAAAGAAA
ncbi:MAG TPA: sugar ABC transporter ATP-binding protein [Candidatus Dormibacteraeota bacterium]|nr:sugar ABC transporter ATP-binding protein [Candidatus Dormibacteraeota bacterium]